MQLIVPQIFMTRSPLRLSGALRTTGRSGEFASGAFAFWAWLRCWQEINRPTGGLPTGLDANGAVDGAFGGEKGKVRPHWGHSTVAPTNESSPSRGWEQWGQEIIMSLVPA